MPSITFRNGTLADRDFIITCITEAEKAGTNSSSWQNLFNISEEELRIVLNKILEEEILGSELCCDNYILAIDNGMPVGGVAAWIEGASAQGSNSIRSNLFSYYLGAEKWGSEQEKLKAVSQNEIARIPGTLQFEDVYVIKSHRGFNIMEKLMIQGVKQYLQKHPELKLAQGFTLSGNIPSITTMKKLGYKQTREVVFSPEVQMILPGKGKTQWELDLRAEFIPGQYK